MIIKCLLLAGLIRVLLATEMPFLCAGLYAGLVLVFGLAIGHPFSAVMLGTAIALALAGGYFWLLNRLDSGSGGWWLVAVLGIVIGIV